MKLCTETYHWPTKHAALRHDDSCIESMSSAPAVAQTFTAWPSPGRLTLQGFLHQQKTDFLVHNQCDAPIYNSTCLVGVQYVYNPVPGCSSYKNTVSESLLSKFECNSL
jgi:hypothetical protein